MRPLDRSRFTILLLACVLSGGLFGILGCSGSSSSDGTSTATSSASLSVGPTSGANTTAATGGLVFTFTDAPTDEFVSVFVTIGDIELLSVDFDELGDDSNAFFISGGRQTFDLLMLRNVAQPFVIAENIPLGIYSRARLEIERVELVRRTEDGELESVFPLMLQGNRIEFPLEGRVEISETQTAVVQLDIDAARSIFPNGNGDGSFGFVPLVRARSMQPAALERLVYAEGIVRGIDRSRPTPGFRVCEIPVARQEDNGLFGEHCLSVYTDDDTTVIDDAGYPIAPTLIRPTDRIAVHGRFVHDEQRSFALAAEVVELGGSEAFSSLSGVVVEDYDSLDDSILVEVDPAQGFDEGSYVEITFSNGTKAFSSVGREVNVSAIARGQRVEVDGVLESVVGRGDRIRAAVIFLGAPPVILPTVPYRWVRSDSFDGWIVDDGFHEWTVPIREPGLVIIVPTPPQPSVGFGGVSVSNGFSGGGVSLFSPSPPRASLPFPLRDTASLGAPATP